MVSFICDHCQETVKKPKADQHVNRCWPPALSCVDCSVSFTSQSYKSHTSCISEAEKYQKSLYKAPRSSKQNNDNNQRQQQHKQQQLQPPAAPAATPVEQEPTPAASPVPESKKRAAADEEPAKESKKAKKDDAKIDVAAALKEIGSTSGLDYDDLVKKVAKQLRRTHKDLDKKAAKKAVSEQIKFTISADGNVSANI
ncbi:hypothetical protein AMAG_12880 [Allomyces macrogynus ATCC 38327]|uniref:Zinc finger C2H2 LYAR-type domain-containing protein n=1 Tax=Allomyces macrogynus (strain ATCC 38327) TaxID=578462 RepID=A0A0L0T0A3_ALLM3|nr:hypothetical protein AMAG_12880 [Allomyces macrogynus ATCC 38327]|eukprot:KNE68201.1 hypothetical protein AMAG_12880 [Allomyces macrogynus ATCC 38327]